MAFSCTGSCGGSFGSLGNGMAVADCSSGGGRAAFLEAGLNSCPACQARADRFCEQSASNRKPNLTSGISRMRSASGTVNDFGGLSFQCANEPFAYATGKEEMPEDDGLKSEPPWWALTALGWVAGLKKTKTCICDLTNGSQVTLTDCNRLRSCGTCCTNAHGENFSGSAYDPNNTSFTQG